MPTIGSESYSSSNPLETRDKNTYSSRIPPENVRGPDLPLLPIAESLEPAELEVPGEDTEVVVTGKNFNEGSVIVWNGGDEATSFIDTEHLSTIAKPSTVEAPLPLGLPVAVRNGEITSNAVTFTFVEAPPPPPEEGEAD